MKNIILFLVIFFYPISFTSAQHELSFGAGYFLSSREYHEQPDITMWVVERESALGTYGSVVLELQYKYRVSDQFVLGASVPYFFGENIDIYYSNVISRPPWVDNKFSGKYKKQSTGLILQAELRPNFAKNLLCLHAGFGYLYHTIHKIDASWITTKLNFTTTRMEENVTLSLLNRFEYTIRAGAAFQAKIKDNIGIKFDMTHYFVPGVESKTPYQILRITQHIASFNAGIIYYL